MPVRHSQEDGFFFYEERKKLFFVNWAGNQGFVSKGVSLPKLHRGKPIKDCGQLGQIYTDILHETT
jgi:hypothetical protein